MSNMFISTTKFKSSIQLLADTGLDVTKKLCRAVAVQIIEDKKLVDVIPKEKLDQMTTGDTTPARFSELHGFLMYVFRHAAYHGVKPETLSAHLQTADVEESAAKIISGVYGQAVGDITEHLRQWTIEANPTAIDISWQTGIELSSTTQERAMESVALLTFSTDEGDRTVSMDIDTLRALKSQLDVAKRQMERVVQG